MKRLLPFLILFVSSFARAEHTDATRQTDFSAFTLHQGELRLGLFQEEVGLFDWLEVGTYSVPWILGPLAGGFSGDLYLKLKPLDVGGEGAGRFALALKGVGFLANVEGLEVSGVEDGGLKAAILPLSVVGSYVLADAWTLSLDATMTRMTTTGSVQHTSDSTVFGVGAQNNFQLAAILEWRINRHFALNLVTRLAPYIQDLQVESELAVDAATSATISATLTSADKYPLPWLVQPGVTWSVGHFYLQAGLGYGNLFLPGLRLVGSVQTIVPDFDVYFRF